MGQKRGQNLSQCIYVALFSIPQCIISVMLFYSQSTFSLITMLFRIRCPLLHHICGAFLFAINLIPRYFIHFNAGCAIVTWKVPVCVFISVFVQFVFPNDTCASYLAHIVAARLISCAFCLFCPFVCLFVCFVLFCFLYNPLYLI